MSERLTPYDTGCRAEPHVWVKDNVPGLPDGDYGRVDFDNEEGGTVLTVHVERTARGYMLCVDNLSADLSVEVNGVVVTLTSPDATSSRTDDIPQRG